MSIDRSAYLSWNHDFWKGSWVFWEFLAVEQLREGWPWRGSHLAELWMRFWKIVRFLKVEETSPLLVFLLSFIFSSHCCKGSFPAMRSYILSWFFLWGTWCKYFHIYLMMIHVFTVLSVRNSSVSFPWSRTCMLS